MKKKRKATSIYPSIFKMFTDRIKHEGRYQEMKDLLDKYMNGETNLGYSSAMWRTIRDMGYTDAQSEREKWDEFQKTLDTQRGRELRIQEMDYNEIESQIRELMKKSEGQKFDAVSGIEWVASVFHLEAVCPSEAPHIIAWNILQTSKKYEVAFFKEFLMKALQRGMTVDVAEEFQEDESEINDLRKAVQEAVGEQRSL